MGLFSKVIANVNHSIRMSFKKNSIILPLHLLLVFLHCIPSSAEILWEAPIDITGRVTDFNLEGALLTAKNGGGETVDIDTGGEVISFTNSGELGDEYGNADPHNRGEDQDYEDLLGSFTWTNNENPTLDLTGLTAGHDYVIQLWIADTRSIGRMKTFDSGANTDSVTLDAGAPSQYLIGRFTATGATHPLRFVGAGGGTHPQFNALMVRDLGPPIPKVNTYEASDGTNTSSTGLNITSGTNVTLSWATDDATTVSISSVSGPLPLNGTTVVSPSSTTTYTLIVTNSLGSVNESVTIHVEATPVSPVINEILASNGDGIQDLDGENSDWI